MKSFRDLINLVESKQNTMEDTQDINVSGLTPRQQFLADIIWQCDSEESLNRFINSLPTDALRHEATTVVEMIMSSAIDKDIEKDDLSQAKDVLSKFR